MMVMMMVMVMMMMTMMIQLCRIYFQRESNQSLQNFGGITHWTCAYEPSFLEEVNLVPKKVVEGNFRPKKRQKTHRFETGWWQLKDFLCSSRSLGKRFPIWRTYFSKGLVQPPTRKVRDVFSGVSIGICWIFLKRRCHHPYKTSSQTNSSPLKSGRHPNPRHPNHLPEVWCFRYVFWVPNTEPQEVRAWWMSRATEMDRLTQPSPLASKVIYLGSGMQAPIFSQRRRHVVSVEMLRNSMQPVGPKTS